MPLVRNADSVYRSDLLSGLPWLTHGFGTRLSGDWPGAYVRVGQIHSNLVLSADNGSSEVLGKADAIVCRTPGRLIGIRTADCVPLLLVDPAHRAVAAVHAGWRGTVQDIAGAAVARMRLDYETNPEGLLAAIGPAIGHCCYEVGLEVSGQFRSLFPEAGNLSRVDLVEANRRLLLRAGLRNEAIDSGELCTRCGEEFHSYRRDREASGRMVAAIGVLP